MPRCGLPKRRRRTTDHPATGGAGSDHTILWTMYDTLEEWDYDTLKPKPGLAKWSYPNPKTMILDITKDIKFHDGTPLDAEAVKFNIERNRQDQRSNVKADLTSVEAVEVTGPLQVTLRLKNPDTALPAILSDRAGMMVSPTNIKALGNDTNRKPVGAGPWKFVSWASSRGTSTIGVRAGRISTASNFPSFPNSRPRFVRSSPARTTWRFRCRHA